MVQIYKNRITRFEKFLMYFTLVDILFAPYVFFIATTYSQIIIFFWFLLKNKKYFNSNEVKLYFGFLFFILISLIVSFFVIPSLEVNHYIIENIKRGANIGLAVSYYFFFYYIFNFEKIKIEKWLTGFVIFITLWGVLYFLNLGMFLNLKIMFNPRDATLSNLVRDNFFLRFNFIWTDPNNVGYMLVAVVSYLIMNKQISNIQLIFILLFLLFNLMLIMSAGSLFSAIIFIPAAYFLRIKNSRKITNIIMILITLIILVLIVNKYYSVFSSSEIGETAIKRIENKNESGDTRPLIWKELLDSKNILLYLFAGEGTIIFVNGEPFSPHNGHFVFIFGYGMLAYFFYLYIVFRKTYIQKWNDYIYILPLFLCFTVNIGIGELKFAAIMYLLIAMSRSGSFINQNRININKNKAFNIS